MVIYFIIIKHTIPYEFITFTHTMMIGQLHTSSIGATRVCRIFNPYVCTLLQLVTDIHLFK